MKDALRVAAAHTNSTSDNGTTATATGSADTHNNKVRESMMEKGPSPATAGKAEALRCPRCDSANTKFCYYNNYSLAQPRHFCKACKRYWTRGGTLRNVPVGGGCRKNKRAAKKHTSAAAGVGNLPRPLLLPPPDHHPLIPTNSLPAAARRPGVASDAAATLYAHHALQMASLPLLLDGLTDASYSAAADLLQHLGLGVPSSNQDLGFHPLPPVNSILNDDSQLIGSSLLPSTSLLASSVKHPMKQLEDQFDQTLFPFDSSTELETSALMNGGITGMMKEVKLESQGNNVINNSFSQNWQNTIIPSDINSFDNFIPPPAAMYWNSTTGGGGGGISWSDFNTNCSSSIAPLI
ncbi:uncharacterized protein LOC141832676 isoform X2 [Curcuma longa]